uniref:Uncharacterized protein AlNc14C5G772 n=1 Tax=Albugo laibachii Nc14 TaxID=890382 RepID=F0W0Z2_9STRA|nr:conserved hypothetical protein [Albugo laibachii Nc14]|eukprot:CCA14716.1 conserved hypothetical protein [Albugo laibachii Nc14]
MKIVRVAVKRIYTSTRVPAEGSAHDNSLKTSILALLFQEETLIKALTDEQYQFQCPWIKSSIGQHVRHSLDHFTKPLETSNTVVRYDLRDRNTDAENRVKSAEKALLSIRKSVENLEMDQMKKSVTVSFMLSADGKECEFLSTLGREMAFAAHHCIHHNAAIKQILQRHFPICFDQLPSDFGTAPSTTNFHKMTQEKA